MKTLLTLVVIASLTFAVLAARSVGDGISDAASKRAKAIERIVG